MKMHNVANVVERFETKQDKQFTIKASAHSFQILSSGLYSNKPGAIIRELSCNAIDSHIAAGTIDIPFEVKLPNALDNTFYVKDCGTGLSHQQVMTLYTTYFESTKSDSDDYIGQLGLGSKSPYCYTDNFLVESRYNGTLNIYSCYTDENGCPAISLMGSCDTVERNGVTVSFPVEKDDFASFRSAARDTFMYFEHKPTIIGAEVDIPAVSYRIRKDNWGVRNNVSGVSGVKVIQGGVAYPVDMNLICRSHNNLSNIKDMQCDLFVNIGDVDIAPSREALQYNKRTIANIVEILNNMVDHIVSELQQQLDSCDTDWKKRVLFDSWWNVKGDYQYQQLFRGTLAKLLKIGGAVATSTINIDQSKVNVLMWHRSNGNCNKNKYPMEHMVIDSNVKVVVFNNYRGIKPVIQSMMNNGYHKIVSISPHQGCLYNQADVDDMLSQFGNPTIENHSAYIPIKSTSTSTYVKRDKNMRLVWSGFNGKGYDQSHVCWNRQMIDLADGGVYVRTHRCVAETKNGTFYSYLRGCQHLKIIPTIIGLTEAECKKVENDSNWVELSDYLDAKLQQLNNNDTIVKMVGLKSALDELGHNTLKGFSKMYSDSKHLITNTDFCDMASGIDITMIDDLQGYIVCRQHLGNKFDFSNVNVYKDQYINKWKDIINKWPMLYFVSWDKVHNANNQLIIDYINS